MQVTYTLETLAKCADWADKAAKEAAEAISTYETLKDAADDVLAEYTVAEMKAQPELSRAEAEMHARASKPWRDYQIGLGEARKKAAIAKVRSQSAQRFWETTQSGLSYLKAEMQRIHGSGT